MANYITGNNVLQYGGFKCQHGFLTPEFSSSQLANAEAKLILTEDIVHCSPALR